MRCWPLAVVVLALPGVLSDATAPLLAQSSATQVAPAKPGYVVPRTSWGDPDLEGIWPSIDMVRVPLERPRQYGERVIMTAEEQAVLQKREDEQIARMAREGAGGQLGAPGHWVEWGTSQRQTSLLVDPPDGRMPAMTAAARARLSAMPQGTAGFGALNGPQDFTMWERCVSRGVLGSTLPVLYNSGIDITQGPGFVAIRYEMVHDVRVIPLDRRPHLPAAITHYMGDARGRWDGTTLVVDTTRFNGRVGLGVNGLGVPPGPAMTLRERFTRVAIDTIRYEATVNDPESFAAPWTVAFPLTRTPDYIMGEYACHEGNHGLRFALSGARAEEAKGMGK